MTSSCRASLITYMIRPTPLTFDESELWKDELCAMYVNIQSQSPFLPRVYEVFFSATC